MSMATGWRRMDAEHWVHVLLMLETTLVSLGAVWASVRAVAMGVPLLALVAAALVALAGWLTSAWRRERPWAWWVLATLSGVGLVLDLGDLVATGWSWWPMIGLLVNGGTVLLLSHPDCVARIQPAPAERAPIP